MLNDYVWLFPIIFIFHDMEEIIGFGIWLKNNKQFLMEKYPSALSSHKDFTTEGFSFAVFEELVLCIILSVLAFETDIASCWYIWVGAFVGCTLHFVVHIVQALWLRQYIPATYTSIICLPISIWILYRCFLNIDDVWWYIAICIVVGIVIVVVNLKFAQKMIGWFTHKEGLTPLI